MFGLFVAVLALFHLSEFAFSAVYTSHELGWHSARPPRPRRGTHLTHTVAAVPFSRVTRFPGEQAVCGSHAVCSVRVCGGAAALSGDESARGGHHVRLAVLSQDHSPATARSTRQGVCRSIACTKSWFGVRHTGRSGPQGWAADRQELLHSQHRHSAPGWPRAGHYRHLPLRAPPRVPGMVHLGGGDADNAGQPGKRRPVRLHGAPPASCALQSLPHN